MKKILTSYLFSLTMLHTYLLPLAFADSTPINPTTQSSYNAAVESALDSAEAIVSSLNSGSKTPILKNSSKNYYYNNWEFNQSVKYSVGKFGTNLESKTLEENSILQKNFSNADFSINIPYIWQSGNITTTSSGAVIVKKTSFNNKNSGLGDISFDGNYYLMQEENNAPLDVLLTCYLKAPTASLKKGLGTGQWDGGPGLGFNKKLTTNIKAIADIAYTFDGKSSDLEIKNQTSFDGGLEYDVNANLVTFVKFDYASASVQGISQAEDIALSMDYKLNNDWRVNAEFAQGLSNGAPDETYLLGATMQFDNTFIKNIFSTFHDLFAID